MSKLIAVLAAINLWVTVVSTEVRSMIFPPSVSPAQSHYERPSLKNGPYKDRVIVFVHGMFGDADSTWRYSPSVYWPNLLLADPAFRDSDVYVASYSSPYLGNTMNVDEVVNNLNNRLTNDEVFSKHREVVFVCHSLGGLIVQRLLLTFRSYAQQVPFIYFFATPETGAQIATLGSLFSSDPLLKAMFAGDENGYLQNLENEWKAEKFPIHRFCAYEKKKYKGVLVVDRLSGTRNCDDPPIPINEDHLGIVKPSSTEHESYIALRNAVRDNPVRPILPPKPPGNSGPRVGDSDRMQPWILQLGKGTPSERLAGVSVLGAFMSSSRPEQRSEAELALSNAIAIEASQTVRHAIVYSFANLDPKIVGPVELDKVISLLAQASRGLVLEGDLWCNRSFANYGLDRPQDGSPEARAKDVAHSIAALLRKGAKPHDLSGIYLVRCDLSNLNLPRTNFDNSILAWSDFHHAVLSEASFNGSDLEGTSFVEADLRGAHLTNMPSRPANSRLLMDHDYAFRDGQWPWGRPRRFSGFGPDFSCADLREADFRGHSIFFVASNSLIPYFTPPRFTKADLSGADFRLARVYGIVYTSEWPDFPISILSALSRIGNFEEAGGEQRYVGGTSGNVEQYTAAIGDTVTPGAVKFAGSFQSMAAAFALSKWQSAKLPGSVRKVLEEVEPPAVYPPDPPCTLREK